MTTWLLAAIPAASFLAVALTAAVCSGQHHDPHRR